MNNIYFIGMCISMALYVVIGVIVSRRVKSIDDYYVAGRNAPTFLISGSLIASYVGVALFMGDAAESYSGIFSSIVFLAIMQTAGYIIGAVFFGRYLRRSGVLTIPEFFMKRFASTRMKNLSALTAIVTMSVYLISIVQGIGTLMNVVTGVDYKICVKPLSIDTPLMMWASLFSTKANPHTSQQGYSCKSLPDSVDLLTVIVTSPLKK